MIQLTEITRTPNQVFHKDGTIELLGYFISASFILFNKIQCSCEFERLYLEENEDIKLYIENQLIEDFKNVSVTQLEGKPSNLKTKKFNK